MMAKTAVGAPSIMLSHHSQQEQQGLGKSLPKASPWAAAELSVARSRLTGTQMAGGTGKVSIQQVESIIERGLNQSFLP